MADKSVTYDDVEKALRAAGVDPAAVGNVSASDLQRTLDAAGLKATAQEGGVSFKQDGFGDTPEERAALRTRQSVKRTTPAPGPGFPDVEPTPEVKARAERRGYPAQMLSGAPIVGPVGNRLEAAIEALPEQKDTTLGQRYDRSLSDIQQADKFFAKEHPWGSTAAQFGGAAATMGPMAMTRIGQVALGMRGPTFGSRLYSGMAGGAGVNMIDSTLRGEDPIKGGMVGAAGGAAGPAIGSMARGATRFAADYLWPRTGPLANMNQGAINQLTAALEGETPQSILAARNQMGPHGMLSDVSSGMTDIAGGLAHAAGPQKGIVREAYRVRDAGAAQRIETMLDSTIGTRANLPLLEKATTAAKKAAADPLYDQFRNTVIQPTNEIKALIPRLEKAGAFDMAEKLSGVTGDPVNMKFFTGGSKKDFPTAQTWDYVKRGLDAKIEDAYSSGNKTMARALVGLKNEMLGEIDKAPGGKVYAQARKAFAEHSDIQDQVTAGRDTFLGARSGMTADELREDLKGLHGPLLAARVVGLRSAAADAMRATSTGDTTLRNKILAPENQDKIKLLLGNKKGNELIDSMKQEKFLKDQSQNVKGGSQTTSNTERVNRLKQANMPEWNPNIAEPLSWVPPSWINQLRPSHVIEGWRGLRHGDTMNQLAQAVLTPEGPQMNQLIAALAAEQRRAAGADAVGASVGNLLTGAISGPATTTARPSMTKRRFPVIH